MAITSTEFLRDSVEVHYWCKRPWGVPDEYAVMDVPYESLSKLPCLPPLSHRRDGGRDVWEEWVDVPARNVRVSFHFARWEESDDCSMEALIGGPYLGKWGEYCPMLAETH